MAVLLTIAALCVAFVSAQDFFATNSSSTTGPWEPSPSYQSSSTFLVANLTEAQAAAGNVSVVFDADVAHNANYTVTLYTPGCIQDASCAQRGVVNVTGDYVSPVGPDHPSSRQISQTNNYDKHDEIYLGPVNISRNGFRPTVTVAAMKGSGSFIVAQKVGFVMLNSSIATNDSETASTQSGTATAGTETATKTASVTVTATARANSVGLNEGARVGIGVGVSLGVLLIAAMASAVYFRRRRTKAARLKNDPPYDADDGQDDPKLPKPELNGGSLHAELPGGLAYTELPDKAVHRELPGGSVHPHELSGLDS